MLMPSLALKILLGFFTALFFTLACARASIVPDANPVEIRVGIYAPFSGEKAFIGRNILGALEMASEEAPTAKLYYTFYTLDTETGSEDPTVALQKFVDFLHISVLVTEAPETGQLAAAVAKKDNILHFCLANGKGIADGKNNFTVWHSEYQHASVLKKELKSEFVTRFRSIYQTHPVTEAGYAFDVFHILDKSLSLALSTRPNITSEGIAEIKVLASGTGVMGAFHLEEHGFVYTQPENNLAHRVQGLPVG